ncbi:hypothetical protein [Pseudomonas pseudonitroreducens]|nr:hypothetical protein [Pseudomonas pseudonitroreducens]
MPLEYRIKRWYCEAQRRGRKLERILLHPNDYQEARNRFPFLPIKVMGD